MQEVGGDEEVALDTTLELELLVTHGKETLEKKAQNQRETMREKEALKIGPKD